MNIPSQLERQRRQALTGVDPTALQGEFDHLVYFLADPSCMRKGASVKDTTSVTADGKLNVEVLLNQSGQHAVALCEKFLEAAVAIRVLFR